MHNKSNKSFSKMTFEEFSEFWKKSGRDGKVLQDAWPELPYKIRYRLANVGLSHLANTGQWKRYFDAVLEIVKGYFNILLRRKK
jgi:hypothetical protein